MNLIGGAQSTTTDGGGGFAFNLLPIGAYSVEAELTGYTPATAVVPVQLDRTAAVTLSLTPVSFTSEIVVTLDVPGIVKTRPAPPPERSSARTTCSLSRPSAAKSGDPTSRS